MVYIYVLECAEFKFYVGKTSSPNYRIEDHFTNGGSAWTRKYKPTRIDALIPNCSDFDEDKYVKEYMNLYGIENVRGGAYSQIELDEMQLTALKRELASSTNLCFICQSAEHFADYCPQKIPFCYKCKRNNHETEDCFATTTIDGAPLKRNRNEFPTLIEYSPAKKTKSTPPPMTTACFRCGRTSHFVRDCFASTHVDGSSLEDDTDSSDDDEYCFRCGREGHYARECRYY